MTKARVKDDDGLPLAHAPDVQPEPMRTDDPGDMRDRALLCLGFASGCRRSELVGLDVGDISFGDDGFEITIRRSKTDQEGLGRKVGKPATAR